MRGRERGGEMFHLRKYYKLFGCRKNIFYSNPRKKMRKFVSKYVNGTSEMLEKIKVQTLSNFNNTLYLNNQRVCLA